MALTIEHLPDDVLGHVMWMWVGEARVDRWVGTLAGVSRRWRGLARDRRIWERAYLLMFPPTRFATKTPKHIGPCSFRRCRVGWGYYTPDAEYSLSTTGFVLRPVPYFNTQRQRMDANLVPTRQRCCDPAHYRKEDMTARPTSTKYRDTFKRAALKYHETTRRDFVWTGRDEKWLADDRALLRALESQEQVLVEDSSGSLAHNLVLISRKRKAIRACEARLEMREKRKRRCVERDELFAVFSSKRSATMME